MPKDSRKIAAILAADIVGYSRLMGADEEGTLRALKIRRAIFDRLAQEFDGKEFGSVGDSLMAQFPSAINAVRCALNLQHAIAEENDSVPADRRMALRIGINLGDVIEENGALFGDGVNIAARLQAMATPGGVLVSGAVHEQVKNKLSANFTFIGARQVKNIAEPVACYEVTEPVAARFNWRLVPWLRHQSDRGKYRVRGAGLTLILLLTLGGGIFWRYQRAGDTLTVAAPTPSTAVATAPEHSIAVLPFVNMSSDREQEYFSDGVAEEVLNLLVKLPELKVIARTSSFAYKGKDTNIADIARELGVAHVLEGSVRRAGSRVRITAQLIRASDSTHLWSERYDRPFDDIFAVQDEIANAVVSELKIKLLDAAPKAKAKEPKAFTLYLQARDVSRQYTASAFEQSISLYRQALEHDPGYPEAWVGLATIYINQVNQGLRLPDGGIGLARKAIQNALALDPKYALAYAELGGIAIYYDRDLENAARHIEHALALDPANTDIIYNAAILSRRLGRLDQAIRLGEYLVAHDPVNAEAHYALGLAHSYAGRLDAALAEFRTVLVLSPQFLGGRAAIGEVLVRKGDAEAGLAEIRSETDEAWRLEVLSIAHHALGQSAESDAAFAELTERHGRAFASSVAIVAAFRGETDLAFEWLEKAAQYRDASLGAAPIDPLFENLHKDRRWVPFLRKYGMAPEQLAAIKFDVTVP